MGNILRYSARCLTKLGPAQNLRSPGMKKGCHPMLNRFFFLPLASLIFVVSGCGGSSGNACDRVGTALCARVYACYTAPEIAQLQYPATEAECVTLENANCTANPPKPGFCKSGAQTSDAAANACADELNRMTCDALKTPTSSGACKAQLCAP